MKPKHWSDQLLEKPLLGILLSVCVLYTIANICGLGYTYDSHLYVDIANQIADKGIFQSEGLKIKPPLYPLLINLFGEVNLVFVNLFLLLTSMVILYGLGAELQNRKLKWLYWVSIAFSTPMILVHSFTWTEPLFITTLLLMLFMLVKYEKSRDSIPLLVVLILLFVLPFIRFAGLFVLMPTVIYLLITTALNHRRILALISGVGALLLLLWVMNFEQGFIHRWNVLISPFVKGDFTRYVSNLDSYIEALSIWIMPLTIYKPLRMSIAALAVIMLIYIAIRSFRSGKGILISGIFLIFTLYYFLLQTVFDVAYYSAERYLTPFYNVLMLGILLNIEANLPKMKLMMKRLIFGVIIIWTLYVIARAVKNVIFWNQGRCEQSGISHNSER